MDSMNARVLIVDDEDKLRKLLARIIALEGYLVQEAATLSSARKILESVNTDLVLCDVKLPDGNGVDFVAEVKARRPHVEIILLTAYGNIPDGVQAIKNGAFDYIVKGDDNDKIIPLLAQAAARVSGKRGSKLIRAAKTGKGQFNDIIGDSAAIKAAVSLAQKVAPTDTTVLLTGETGTGKEVFAQAIHYNSKRKDKAFLALNCSGFTKELLESELFGHKAGAFTGASKDKKGLIEEASGGTLFLDEIGELPTDLQPKLLRLLEDGSYFIVGDTKPKKADVRVISATNRSLEKEIADGHYRSDLYYRISTFVIELPPLRNRRKDIPMLASHFLSEFSAKGGKQINSIDEDAAALLQNHDWKGNIRELKNVIERAIVLEDGNSLSAESLPFDWVAINENSASPLQLAAVEQAHIRKVLQATNGNKAEAARILGIGIATLYRKLAEYGVS
jgi:DNA-binding NtrC family response regulator